MAAPSNLLESISADLPRLYNATTGFAESVTGPLGAFLGIFSRESVVVEGEVPMASRVPVLRCRDADAPAKGQAVTIRGTAYTIVEVSPDGYGETVLRLHK